ncbi:hypothetical protein IW140_003796 [Coemansia sp. RSA 1813]|nr:hypothetical protein EV178_004565 [Coemansia sp. RSA 1646]KAJ1769765.1 hypothetical protein LPJ74_003790 [Coemansia sp. RSA 1843]KAJ2090117.1 hypothetical protein IW138_002927 [Coemansia sp. RSA 986]KAJ2214193.1 hypothetical protein EV179_003213 [Coemansia sp. RSA 487]KAJ2568478.1 hypothetical protein IW140_003796 [Coemansia sp. RSA 1813]
MAHREIHVVVVGGSWAGITAVHELMELSHLTYPRLLITLVEQRTHYFHKTGMIRGLVDKRYADQMFIPYTRLFLDGGISNPNHRFVCARLKKVYEAHVEVEGGGRLYYDYLVLATGTEYSSLPVTQSSSAEECRLMYQTMRDAIEMADRILFIGAGAVGIGMCGEIAEMFPRKRLTIAHARSKLLNPDLSDGFAKEAERKLRQMGVELRIGEAVIPVEPSVHSNNSSSTSSNIIHYQHQQKQWVVRPQVFSTTLGEKIECDLAIWTTGSRPNTEYLATLPATDPSRPHVEPETGRISVRATLQLADPKFPNIFAVGDVNSLPPSERYATSAVCQAKHAVRCLKSLMDECYDFRVKMSVEMAFDSAMMAPMEPYTTTLKRQKTVIVPLGRKHKVTNTLFARFNSWVGGSKRDRKYLIDKAQKMLNY